MILIKKYILEIKILKQCILLPAIFMIIVILMNFINSKNYDSTEFINMALMYISIFNIIITAWMGSFILKDLVEDESKNVIATYRQSIVSISFERLIKIIAYYLILIVTVASNLYYLSTNEEFIINLSSLVLKFALEGLVILIASYLMMVIVRKFALSFSIIISFSVSFYMVLNDFTVIIPDKMKNIINFYLDDGLIYANYMETFNAAFKNLLFMALFFIIGYIILKRRIEIN